MTRSHKVLGHIENLFHHAGKSMFWPFTPDQTMNTDFLSPLHGYKWWQTGPGYLSTRELCSTRDHKAPRHLENLYCRTSNSMFWPFRLG